MGRRRIHRRPWPPIRNKPRSGRRRPKPAAAKEAGLKTARRPRLPDETESGRRKKIEGASADEPKIRRLALRRAGASVPALGRAILARKGPTSARNQGNQAAGLRAVPATAIWNANYA